MHATWWTLDEHGKPKAEVVSDAEYRRRSAAQSIGYALFQREQGNVDAAVAWLREGARTLGCTADLQSEGYLHAH